LASDVQTKEESFFRETFSVIIQALILALILRTFLFQPFNIPSGSMKPTLLVGDYVFVSKFSYGYSRYSFPFGPDIFEGRIWEGTPQRGDVVVFKFPPDTSKDYIKRLIGLPGDKVQMRNGTLYLNGEAVKREAAGNFTHRSDFGRQETARIFKETLPNGVTYQTLDFGLSPSADNTPEYEVPQGHYFFMGDNRDNSSDSRFDVGMVPAQMLVGKAQVIFLSLQDGASAWQIWRWPFDMRWGRIFSGL